MNCVSAWREGGIEQKQKQEKRSAEVDSVVLDHAL